MSLSLYIHIPFCASKCDYCDFVSGYSPRGEYFAGYTAALCHEMELFRAIYPGRSDLSTVYIGGGTPSILSPEVFTDLMDFIRREFNTTKCREITLEANPEDVTRELAECWLSSGVDRVSLGFQSMEDTVLKKLGRRNSSGSNVKAYQLLRKSGFKNISLDWIASVRGENIDLNLKEILSLNPEHISVYQLSVEEKTLLHQNVRQGKYKPLSDDEALGNYWRIADSLKEAGYTHYEISNFAKAEQYKSKHNLNYWDYGEYIGIGCGAAGFLASRNKEEFGTRYSNPVSLKDYFKRIGENKLPVDIQESIDQGTALREYIMLGLRKIEGLNQARFKEFFGNELFQILDRNKLTELSEFLEIDEANIRLSRRGIEVANQVIQKVWDLIGE